MPATLNRNRILICLALALVTLGLYWPVTRHSFVDFDDDNYIAENPQVQAGLTWHGLVWAFDGAHAGNWHPVTWLSHMADCEMFGLNPGAHHLMNVLFHIANTLLLFLFLTQTTSAFWRSAFVAALFAWHPLRVESVAWAAERKDVLSAFFWLLTLITYAKFTTLAKIQNPKSKVFYALALFFFTLGLLSKPMVVTLPFALLLLDVWPLNRFSLPSAKCLFLEKIPFFALSLAASLVTFIAQKSSGAVSPVELSTRLMNAAEAYPRYIFKTLWPVDLSVIYPYRYDWPMTAVAGAVLLLLAISFLAVKFIRQAPWLFTGWFWFLGCLVPVIGLVQVGAASMADRYTYLPGIGLAIVIVWGAEFYSAHRPGLKKFIAPAGGIILAACLAVTSIQISYWRDSFSLFLHALNVTRNNYVADNCLGKAFEKAGDPKEALVLYQEAVRIEPRYGVSQFDLANELMSFGRRAEALPHFEAAAKAIPHNSDFQFDLGLCLLQSGKPAPAVDCFNRALQIQPNLAPAQFYLAEALAKLGRFAEATSHYREALRLRPDFADAQKELNQLLAAHPELR